MSQPKRINKSLREVTAIWRAIQSGDPDLAEQCCVDHIKAAAVAALEHDRADIRVERKDDGGRMTRIRSKRPIKNKRPQETAMKFVKRVLLTLLLSPALPALAEEFPSRPITMVVPFSAGGPGDVIARLLGSSMSATLKQPIVIENVVGAGGTLGTNRVAKAAPDGYNGLLMHVGQATAPALYAKLPFDPVGDFAPIGLVTDVPMLLVARANFPAKDLKELVAYVRTQGDKVTYGNVGLGSASHLCGLMFMSAIESKLTPIYYKGGGPALNDIIAGHIDVYCDPATGPTPYIQAGTIPGYAITSKKRVSTLPNVPTAAEAGVAEIRRHDLVWPVRAAQHAKADRRCAGRRPAKGAQGSASGHPLRRTQHGARRGGARDAGSAGKPAQEPRSSNGTRSSRTPASNRNDTCAKPNRGRLMLRLKQRSRFNRHPNSPGCA